MGARINGKIEREVRISDPFLSASEATLPRDSFSPGFEIVKVLDLEPISSGMSIGQDTVGAQSYPFCQGIF